MEVVRCRVEVGGKFGGARRKKRCSQGNLVTTILLDLGFTAGDARVNAGGWAYCVTLARGNLLDWEGTQFKVTTRRRTPRSPYSTATASHKTHESRNLQLVYNYTSRVAFGDRVCTFYSTYGRVRSTYAKPNGFACDSEVDVNVWSGRPCSGAIPSSGTAPQ